MKTWSFMNPGDGEAFSSIVNMVRAKLQGGLPRRGANDRQREGNLIGAQTFLGIEQQRLATADHYCGNDDDQCEQQDRRESIEVECRLSEQQRAVLSAEDQAAGQTNEPNVKHGSKADRGGRSERVFAQQHCKQSS